MTADLHHFTVAQAGRALRARELSPVELTRACVGRIAALDDRLCAFITVTADRALAEAKAAEAELTAGRDRGPLHGIPYGLKDCYETAGIATTGHSKILQHHVPAADCTVQKKLRAGGGVLLGKQSLWEFTYGGPSFDLPWPPARNPWDLTRSPMGSSTGSAAAIAAGLCPAAMGSDTGGSIRGPAAVCGIAGLKPTYGRISRLGVLPNTYSFDHCGPMAWTVEDCALMLQVVAGHDPADPASLDEPVPDYAAALTRSPRGLRIGVVRHWYEEEGQASPDVLRAMEESLAVLKDLGCSLRDVRLPTMRECLDAKTPITLSEIYAIHARDLRTRPQDFGHSLRWRIMPGALIRGEDYVHAMRWRTALAAQVLAQFAEVDLLVTAGFLGVAPPLAPDEPPTPLNAVIPSITTPFNLAGIPALALCNGFDAAGLPLGLQIAGRPFDEATVLAAGHAFERATGHRARRPAL